MKIVLTIPSKVLSDVEHEVAADQHPTMDYQALADTLRDSYGCSVDVIDHAAVDRSKHPLVRCVRKLAGRNAALALMAFQRRGKCDAIFTNAENVAIPLALLLRTAWNRPRHVTIGHRLSARRKRVFYKLLRAHREMDVIFVYSSAQREFAVEKLGIAEKALRLIPFHADHRFFRPSVETPARSNQICGAGLEWRDYPTFINAVANKTDLKVKLAAASPWSKHANETERCKLPQHIEARRYGYRDLRELYAQSSIVVVPLYQNDFQAGVTTILEAMAMGKPVAVTGTFGQTDVIVDGENGLYIPPGQSQEWDKAITRLQSDASLRERLGRNARRWVEEHATLDHWVERVVDALHGAPVPCASNSAQCEESAPASLLSA